MKTITVLLVLVLSTGMILAQDTKPMGRSGDKALLFSLNGLSNLGAGDFNGGVGMRLHLTDQMAVRVGLGFMNESETTKYQGTGTGADIKESSMQFSIAPGLQYYMMKNGPVSGYVGGQILFASTSSTLENINFVSGNKDETSETVFGAGVFLGVEWFPWNSISLSAEYQLSFMTSSGTMKVTRSGQTTETDAPDVTSIGLASSNKAAFTLSIFM